MERRREEDEEERKLGRLHEGGEEEALVRALVGHGRASRARRTGSARTRGNWITPGQGPVPGGLRRLEVKEAIRTSRLVLRNGRRLTEMPYCLTVTTVKIKPDGTGRHLAGRHQAYIERMVVHGDGRVEPDPAEEILCAAGNIAGDTLSRCRFWDAVEAREARKTPLRQDGGRSYDKPVQIRMILELPYGLADDAYDAIASELVRRIEAMTPDESHQEGYRLRCHAVVHTPPGKELTGPHADEQARNVHMHLVLHDRPARRDADGAWGFHRHKCLELGRKGAIERTKALMCEIINPHMERHGLAWRYHPGSFRDSGLDLEPLRRVPPSYLQRTNAAEGEPPLSVQINRMLIADRQQEVRAWQSRRHRPRRDAREKAARLRAHQRAEREERQRAQKWERAERLAEACEAVVVPARPKHRFNSYQEVMERIYEEITQAPPILEPASARQIAIGNELMKECRLTHLWGDWQRDRGTAGIAIRLLIEGRRQVPERQREAARQAEQARQVDSERDRTEIVALRQERDDLLSVRQEAEALRLQLADTTRALEQETRKVAALNRFASEVITQDVRVLSDLWIGHDLPPPRLTEAGKIDMAGVRGLSTEDIQRLDRLPPHYHGLIKTRIEERLRNKPAPSPQQVLETETPDSLIAQGYGPARIPNEYLLPEQTETLEDVRRKLAAYDDLTLLRIGIVTWAVWAQARRAFDASRTVARITEGEKLKNGYDEIYKLLRARNLPVPSDARAQRPSQRPHGPGGYER